MTKFRIAKQPTWTHKSRKREANKQISSSLLLSKTARELEPNERNKTKIIFETTLTSVNHSRDYNLFYVVSLTELNVDRIETEWVKVSRTLCLSSDTDKITFETFQGFWIFPSLPPFVSISAEISVEDWKIEIQSGLLFDRFLF